MSLCKQKKYMDFKLENTTLVWNTITLHAKITDKRLQQIKTVERKPPIPHKRLNWYGYETKRQKRRKTEKKYDIYEHINIGAVSNNKEEEKMDRIKCNQK